MLTRDHAGVLQKLVQQAGYGYVHIQATELQVTASATECGVYHGIMASWHLGVLPYPNYANLKPRAAACRPIKLPCCAAPKNSAPGSLKNCRSLQHCRCCDQCRLVWLTQGCQRAWHIAFNMYRSDMTFSHVWKCSLHAAAKGVKTGFPPRQTWSESRFGGMQVHCNACTKVDRR